MATTAKGFPYPAPSAGNDVPADVQALAEMVELWPGIPSLTETQRDALAGGAKTLNLVIYNSTAGRLEHWTGAAWNVLREESTSANVPTVTALTAYTLVIGDADKIVETTSASPVTVTIPSNADVAFPIGTEITVVQYGAGKVTLAPAAGVTIRSKAGNLALDARYCAVALYKRATDEWVAIGDLTL